MANQDLTELQKLIVKGNKKMNIVDGDEFRNTMKSVAFLMADKVNKTIGPYAHTTIIDDNYSSYPTKDGWNIINRMEFEDPLFMSICKIIRGISYHLVTKVGDGTSTALCVASKFVNILDSVKMNARQADIVKTLEDIVADAENILTTDPDIHWNIDLETEEGLNQIKRIALVSSNYNEEISEMIYQIYKETQNPSIHVEIDGAEKTHYLISKGYKIPAKCLNIDMVANTDDGSMHINNKCALLMLDHNVTYARHMNLVMDAYEEAIHRQGARKFILMAPNYDQMFIYQMHNLVNQARQQNRAMDFVLLQVPTQKQAQKDALEDLGVIANCAVFNSFDLDTYNMVAEGNMDEHAEDFAKIASTFGCTIDSLLQYPQGIVLQKMGYVSDVTLNTKEFMCGLVTSQRFKDHFSKVEADFLALKARKDKSSSATDLEFTDAYMRYCRLIGNMGYIKIGGKSPLEKQCLKDSVDDAVLACKAATERGFVRGMNISTIEALSIIISKINKNKIMDEETGKVVETIFEGNYTGSPEKDHLVYTLCTTLVLSYKYATLEIFVNKYCPRGTDEERKELFNRVVDIIENCGATRSVYNIITEEYEKPTTDPALYDTYETMETNTPGETIDVHYNLNVVNPAATDIEVLKAVIGILSHILTSNQIETMGKFMRNLDTKEDMRNDDIAKWTEVGANILSLYLNNRPDTTDNSKLDEILNRMNDLETRLNEMTFNQPLQNVFDTPEPLPYIPGVDENTCEEFIDVDLADVLDGQLDK